MTYMYFVECDVGEYLNQLQINNHKTKQKEQSMNEMYNSRERKNQRYINSFLVELYVWSIYKYLHYYANAYANAYAKAYRKKDDRTV